MKKVKKIFSKENWSNKILFAAFTAILLVLVGGSVSFSSLLDHPNPPAEFVAGQGYGYGYTEDSGYFQGGYGVYANRPVEWPGAHPNGSVVKTATSPMVYVIDEGGRRWITSQVAFESWGYRWGDIVTISAAELAGYWAGGGNVQIRPGTLVKAFDSPSIYLINWNWIALWITTVHVNNPDDGFLNFQSRGFRVEDVKPITKDELDTFYNLGTLTENDNAIENGRIIKNSASPNVYLYEPARVISNESYGPSLDWIRSPTSFESWGWGWASIRIVPDATLAWYLALYNTGDVILAKPGTLLKGTATNVYVTDNLAIYTPVMAEPNWPRTRVDLPLGLTNSIDGNFHWKKRWITSATTFTNLGYKWGNIRIVTDTELGLYADGANIPLSM